ncbi:polyribonucleotide nucleotidyltransferase [bacterium]|nr:polyribonucleotide nucleotidyltransferase [bacterium]
MAKSNSGSVKTFTTELAGRQLTIESGRLANQASGSITVKYGDTVVLATAVMGGIREGIDWFPLSVDYEERLYAGGKIKGSRWIKREGRPTDEAVLSGRMIDRTIRPLFPSGIKNDVQVVLTVLSFDGENDADMVSLFAASCALAASDIPWDGPIAGVRVGRVSEGDGQDPELVINPTYEQRERGDMEIVVCGTGDKVIMVEAEGKEVSEEIIEEGITKALPVLHDLIQTIQEVTKEIGLEKANVGELTAAADEASSEASEEDPKKIALKELEQMVETWAAENIPAVLFAKTLVTKSDRQAVRKTISEQLEAFLREKQVGKDRRAKADGMLYKLIEKEVTRAIISEGKRVDGRALDEVRNLSVDVGILPTRTHGSALFSRGETQVLSVVTLGSPGMEQLLDGLEMTDVKKHYMHHYNFPPFSVGETGRIGSPGRREIGHGALAEKALVPVLPSKEDYPYTIRVVSEILGSNGSSSMGSTCGSSLSLMAAGVPIKKAVAGVAMGLASDGPTENGNWKVITDLQDLEDGPGGMDFKITGTVDGITAIQLDTKTNGLTMDIVKQTLTQAKAARLHILEAMDAVIAQPAEMSEHAPRIISHKIDPDKIRDVIGPGGKIINGIIDETGVQIDIEDDGTVLITGQPEATAKALETVKDLTRTYEAGQEFDGEVSRIFNFGAMVKIGPSQEGMVHISELAHSHVATVEDVVSVGDKVKVKVIKIDDMGRVNLSMKALLPVPPGGSASDSQAREERPHAPHGRGARRDGPRKPFGRKR